jgi:serine/threonine protein kinase/tetratricopeptide (TPR) repeat protein
MIDSVLNNRYRIESELGKGAMGVVYKGYDELLKRMVAIKTLLEPPLGEDGFTGILSEAQAAAHLNHPNIVSIYDVDQFNGSPFIVMEYVEGAPLNDLEQLSLSEIIDLARQICAALEHAHFRDIIHRDLKPENVLVTPESTAKLVDFGLAHVLSSESMPEGIAGTLYYIAPDVMRGEGYNKLTDLYSFGVMLYELATNRLPFDAPEASALILMHLNSPVTPPIEHNQELPSSLNKLILQMLSKESAGRPQSATEINQSLASALVLSDKDQATDLPTTSKFLDDLESRFPDAAPEPPIVVSREAELDQLGALLDKALAHEGQIALIHGETGSGKTSLMFEFARRAQDANQDLLIAYGSCTAHTGMGDAYLPFKDVLDMLTGNYELGRRMMGFGVDDARRLVEFMPVAGEVISEYGKDLLDVFLPGKLLIERADMYGYSGTGWHVALQSVVQEQAGKQSQDGQAQLYEQYSRFLTHISQFRPILLFIDDLQWIDTASVELLFHLSRRIQKGRVLIVGAYRSDEVAMVRKGDPHPMQKVITEIKVMYGDVGIDLTQMDEARNKAFINSFIDSQPNQLDEAFRDMLYQTTGGHPLFTVELLQSMRERGDIVQNKAGQWVGGEELDWRSLPARVEGVIQGRISRLKPTQRELLRYASVEGDEFTSPVLAQLSDRGEHKLLRELTRDMIHKQRLIRETASRQIGDRKIYTYKFNHRLFQKYLYEDLGESERTLLHTEVAEILEKLYGDQSVDMSASLAYHFSRADLPQRALPYWIHAGKEGFLSFAYKEAIEHYVSALAHVPEEDLKQRIEIVQDLSEMYSVLGMLEQRSETDADLLEMVEASGDNSLIADAHYRLGYHIGISGQLQLEEESYQRSLEAARLDDNQEIEGVVLGVLAINLLRQGRTEQALQIAEKALRIGYALEEEETLVRILTNAAVCYSGVGKIERGIQLLADQAAITHQIGHKRGKAIGLSNLGYKYLQLGQIALARSSMKQSLQIAEKIGDRRAENFTRLNLGLAYIRDGNPQSAREMLEAALSELQELEDRFAQAACNVYLGLAVEQSEDPSKSFEYFVEAESIYKEAKMASLALDALAGQARSHFAQGEERAATEKAEAVWSHVSEQGGGGMEFPALAYMTCFDIFKPNDAGKSKEVIRQAYDALSAQVDGIENPDWQRSFLEEIPEHRAVISAYETEVD